MIDFLFSFLREYGLFALFLSSLSSNFLLFPAFVELSCIVFLSLGFTPFSIFISLITGSVLGGLLSYFFGFFGSASLLKYKERIRDMEKIIERYGNFSVFLVSFLPVPFPFTLFAMLVGFLKMNVKTFLLAMTAGKALRVCLSLFVLTWGFRVLSFYHLV
ncbi:MAG: VTT domain-containing protein [Candidatus Aenigmatarchaeota archaeon]